MDLLQTIATIVTCLSTIGGAMIAIYRALRKVERRLESIESTNVAQETHLSAIDTKVDKLDQKVDTLEKTVTQRLDNLESARKQDLRVQIKDIYFRYLHVKAIPMSDLKTLDYAYDLYRNTYHGNSYIADLYEQMHTWEIVPDNDERVKF